MNDEQHKQKRRAVLRVVLGNAQMLSAVVAVVLLWRCRVCLASLIAATLAGCLLVTSIIVFRVVWR